MWSSFKSLSYQRLNTKCVSILWKFPHIKNELIEITKRHEILYKKYIQYKLKIYANAEQYHY